MGPKSNFAIAIKSEFMKKMRPSLLQSLEEMANVNQSINDSRLFIIYDFEWSNDIDDANTNTITSLFNLLTIRNASDYRCVEICEDKSESIAGVWYDNPWKIAIVDHKIVYAGDINPDVL